METPITQENELDFSARHCVPSLSVQAYGGYLATMLLSSEEFNQLKCGTAVSPITDFELYGIISHTFFRFHALCLKKPDSSNSFIPVSKWQRLHFQNGTSAQRQIPEYTR